MTPMRSLGIHFASVSAFQTGKYNMQATKSDNTLICAWDMQTSNPTTNSAIFMILVASVSL